MGLFDTIEVKKKLPTNNVIKQFLGKDFDLNSLEYQTKDLDCAMLHYELRSNGDLYYEHVEYRQSTPEEVEQEKQEAKRNKWFPRFHMREKSREWVKSTETRDVEFYAYFKHKDDRYYSLDYKAHIVKGKVKSIKLFKSERETDQQHAERLQIEAKWAEDFRRHNQHVNRLSYKIINNIYNKPVRGLLRNMQRYSQKLPTLLYKLERKILY